MSCPSCGKPVVDEDALSCLFCGEPLDRPIGLMGTLKYGRHRRVLAAAVAIAVTAFLVLVVFL